MNLNAFRDFLSANPDVGLHLMLPDGDFVPAHFHITEVGRVRKDFIDCGGTVRSATSCVLQVWVADDVGHRLDTTRVANIIRLGGFTPWRRGHAHRGRVRERGRVAVSSRDRGGHTGRGSLEPWLQAHHLPGTRSLRRGRGQHTGVCESGMLLTPLDSQRGLARTTSPREQERSMSQRTISPPGVSGCSRDCGLFPMCHCRGEAETQVPLHRHPYPRRHVLSRQGTHRGWARQADGS